MVIGFILCLIGNYVCHFIAANIILKEKDLKKKKTLSDFFTVTGIILSIASGILLINILDSNNNDSVIGKYNYYVNGKKVSSSYYFATKNLFLGIVFTGFFFSTGMILPDKIINGKNKLKVKIKEKKPNIIVLILSIVSALFGFILAIPGISGLTRMKLSNSTPSIIAIILGIVLIIIGTCGIVRFMKNKKNRYN